MELKLINSAGEQVSLVAVSQGVFGQEWNERLVHQVLVAYQANRRSGNRAQKDRSMVRHSTKKPWRQKGTGRARVGMTASPLWRGGGKVFPNSSIENFSHKVNRKMYRLGMSTILSQLVREERIVIVDSFNIHAPKTKLFSEKIKCLGGGSLLFIMDAVDENLYLSSRNLPNVRVIRVSEADPESLIHFDKVILTKEALLKMEEVLV